MTETDSSPVPTFDYTADDATKIVCAYVSSNPMPAAEVPGFMKSIYATRQALGRSDAPVAVPAGPFNPAVPISESVTDDFIICLENGQRFKSLKRHLMTSYSLSPEQYRAKWGLPKDYPMVAPGYAKARSDLAKSVGLGRYPTSAAGKVTSVDPAARSARRAPEAAAA